MNFYGSSTHNNKLKRIETSQMLENNKSIIQPDKSDSHRLAGILLTLALSLATLCPSSVDAGQPDIGTFMQIGSSGLAATDWDSGTMYFISGMSGKTQVYRYMGDDEWPWQLSLFEDGINSFYLSESGKWGIIRASVGGSEQGQ